jgi:hypothetical protein
MGPARYASSEHGKSFVRNLLPVKGENITRADVDGSMGSGAVRHGTLNLSSQFCAFAVRYSVRRRMRQAQVLVWC